MNAQRSLSGPRVVTVVGLVVGALGIAILWASGVKFPIYPPPGIVILLAEGTMILLMSRTEYPSIACYLAKLRPCCTHEPLLDQVLQNQPGILLRALVDSLKYDLGVDRRLIGIVNTGEPL